MACQCILHTNQNLKQKRYALQHDACHFVISIPNLGKTRLIHTFYTQTNESLLYTSACIHMTIFPLQKGRTNWRNTLSVVGIYQKQDMAHCISFQEQVSYTSKGFSTLYQTSQLQSSRLVHLVVTQATPLKIWHWAGCGKQLPTHVEDDHRSTQCQIYIRVPECPRRWHL